MAASEKMLEIISNETMGTVHTMNIVTPTIYKSVFSENAIKHNTPLENEEKISDTLLCNKVSVIQNLQNQTVNSATKLSDSTDKAIHAIQDKDESTLQEVLRETHELRKELEKLKSAVYIDELTNTFNRKWMNDNFLEGDMFTDDGILAIIDLNYFKEINDTYGHVVGDKVLTFIAAQLKKLKGNVIRYGGDEFIVVFQDASTLQAYESINKLRESIIAKTLKSNNISFRVSFSIGLAEFQKNDPFTNIIEDADQNMYKDKAKIKRRISGIN